MVPRTIARPDRAARGGPGPRCAVRARGRIHRWLLGAALLASAALPACKTGPDLSADYAQTAIENYTLAQGEFLDKDYEEAIQYADFVRIRFPFSRYAVEAELLIARAEFEQSNYTTAVDAFKTFAKLHPTHEHVRNGWATFMAAAAAFMNAPQKFFLLPPDYMRDQSQLQPMRLSWWMIASPYCHTSSPLLVRMTLGARSRYAAGMWLANNVGGSTR